MPVNICHSKVVFGVSLFSITPVITIPTKTTLKHLRIRWLAISVASFFAAPATSIFEILLVAFWHDLDLFKIVGCCVGHHPTPICSETARSANSNSKSLCGGGRKNEAISASILISSGNSRSSCHRARSGWGWVVMRPLLSAVLAEYEQWLRQDHR